VREPGLKARKKIAQGKANPRATPWVRVPKNFQALKGRQKTFKDGKSYKKEYFSKA
jgi:hypothetical protein